MAVKADKGWEVTISHIFCSATAEKADCCCRGFLPCLRAQVIDPELLCNASSESEQLRDSKTTVSGECFLELHQRKC